MTKFLIDERITNKQTPSIIGLDYIHWYITEYCHLRVAIVYAKFVSVWNPSNLHNKDIV